MPRLIEAPVRMAAMGEPPKTIDEFVGRASDGVEAVSLAHMKSPTGWAEPGQRPEFDEYTIVLRGLVRVEYEDGAMDARAGQAVHCRPGEWVRYSTPGPDGAEYVSICLPAFPSTSSTATPTELRRPARGCCPRRGATEQGWLPARRWGFDSDALVRVSL